MSDYLGTPLQAFDNNGNKVWEQELDIFGRKKTGNNKSSFIPFKYQGQYEGVETGLYYNRFRYYDPRIGTYISQDPIRLAGGNPTLYGYVADLNTELDLWGLDKGFLESVQGFISRTGEKYQGAEIYVFNKKTKHKGVKYNKGDYFYKDNFHKDHYEVFKKDNSSKVVINLDGSINEKKTSKAKKRIGCRS